MLKGIHRNIIISSSCACNDNNKIKNQDLSELKHAKLASSIFIKPDLLVDEKKQHSMTTKSTSTSTHMPPNIELSPKNEVSILLVITDDNNNNNSGQNILRQTSSRTKNKRKKSKNNSNSSSTHSKSKNSDSMSSYHNKENLNRLCLFNSILSAAAQSQNISQILLDTSKKTSSRAKKLKKSTNLPSLDSVYYQPKAENVDIYYSLKSKEKSNEKVKRKSSRKFYFENQLYNAYGPIKLIPSNYNRPCLPPMFRSKFHSGLYSLSESDFEQADSSSIVSKFLSSRYDHASSSEQLGSSGPSFDSNFSCKNKSSKICTKTIHSNLNETLTIKQKNEYCKWETDRINFVIIRLKLLIRTMKRPIWSLQ